MVNRAQLAASLAALFRQTKAIKELQASRAKQKGQRHPSLALNIWWRIGGSNP